MWYVNIYKYKLLGVQIFDQWHELITQNNSKSVGWNNIVEIITLNDYTHCCIENGKFLNVLIPFFTHYINFVQIATYPNL